MSGPDDTAFFGEYPEDFFDMVIVDECHRGGANDESTWREILEYFSPAVQLGLTATPKRDDNVDTYAYFDEPVYTYSLKDGISDGFLTPFRVRKISTTIDNYVHTADDTVLQGEVEEQTLLATYKTDCVGYGIGVRWIAGEVIEQDDTVEDEDEWQAWFQIWLTAFPNGLLELGR